MNGKLVLDIDSIQIIAHKTEKTAFHFFNPKRIFDGFIMITSGSGYVTDSDGKRYCISKGDMIITNKDAMYSFDFDAPCSYVTLGFSLNTQKDILPFVYKCTEIQYAKVLDVCKIWQSRSWDSYALCRIALLQLYMEIIQSGAISNSREDFVSKAVSYIHKKFKTNFSGKDISAHCSVSLSYLRSEFLKRQGMSINKYRDSLRIAAAKEMLESEYFTVTEIATQLGYCDVYHFSKVFSAYVGVSPVKWTKQQKNKKL